MQMRKTLVSAILAISASGMAVADDASINPAAANGAVNAQAAPVKKTPEMERAETERALKEAAMKEQAFQNSLNGILPMSPDQIMKFKGTVEATQEALHSTPAPKLVSKTRNVTLKPGATTPQLKMVPGYVTTVVFTDATGAPWPITSVTNGNKEFFTVNKPEGLQPGNLLTITPMADFVDSNLVVTLSENPAPIVIQLFSRQKLKVEDGESSDAMVAFHLDERGPRALAPTFEDPIASPVTEEMSQFLDETPPQKAVRLKTNNDGEITVWRYQDKYYFRTPYPMQWPAWSKVVNGHGVRVYEIPKVVSAVVSKNGKQFNVNIED